MKKINKVFYIISILLIVFSIALILQYYHDVYSTAKERNLLNEVYINENTGVEENINNSLSNSTTQAEKVNETSKDTQRILKVQKLKQKNSDIVGWIQIENTNINYPVVQGSNNDYYLNHNYEKKYNVNGAIFLDKDYSWDIPSSNLLIYGHHSTFKDLLKYQSYDFYKTHSNIRFTTKEEDTAYKILAVFRSKVYYKTDKNVFRYYYFINAKNEKEYSEFVQNAKKASLYETGVTAEYGEQLLTLSTCSYHTQDGRFVVVAVKK